MNASTYIGRIGVLAGALGVGAALFAGPGIASAETPGSGPADSSASDTANPASGPATAEGADTTASSAGPRAGASEPAQRPRTSLRAGRVSADTSGNAGTSDTADATPDALDTLEPLPPRRATAAPAESATAPEIKTAPGPAAGTPAAAATPGDATPVAVATAAAESVDAPEVIAAADEGTASPSAPEVTPTRAETVVPAEAVVVAPALDPVVRTVTEAQPLTAAPTQPAVDPAATLPAVVATAVNKISTAVSSLVSQLAQTFSWGSPFAPPAESPANWLLLAAARRELGAAAATPSAAQTAAPAGPTLFVLNGYNVVASSPQLVTSFYGPFVNFPGFPGVQGVQSFDLVDPRTDTSVASFRALQSTFHAIGTARQFVVTEVLSGDPSKVPAVGSIINANGDLLFGTVYTAEPGGKVTYDIVTPFGKIPQFTWYNAATGLTDYVEVNKPVKLDGGFFIAPTTPSTERFTSITGLPPLFAALQGVQEYSLFDKSGASVGGFEGLVTTTSDVIGLFTKAILVTDTGDSTNVGTGVGQVPPVGTVYNLINFSEQFYVLYSSMPSPSGNVFSTKVVTPFGSFDIPFPLDASAVPDVKLQVPGSYKFVPTSDMVPSGVNGLPPREVILQGYQQFDVVDVFGNSIGSVDANVMRQWDWFGGTSTAVMVTEVRSGSTGLLPWNVPPVGSVFNFRVPYGINIGLSDFYSSVPTALGSIVTFQTVTPFGVIPLFLPNDLSKGLTDALYVNPFRRMFQV